MSRNASAICAWRKRGWHLPKSRTGSTVNRLDHLKSNHRRTDVLTRVSRPRAAPASRIQDASGSEDLNVSDQLALFAEPSRMPEGLHTTENFISPATEQE